MALQDDVRNLAANPTLGELEPDALRLIAFSAETRILRSGDVLFRAGEPSDGGFVVLSGGIELIDGRESPVVVGPPTLIGDSALICETARPCTAVASEPSSVLKISRTLFHRVLSEHPQSATRLRRSLGTKLLSLRGHLSEYERSLR